MIESVGERWLFELPRLFCKVSCCLVISVPAELRNTRQQWGQSRNGSRDRCVLWLHPKAVPFVIFDEVRRPMYLFDEGSSLRCGSQEVEAFR